jgi:hypothetical protein
MVDEMRKQLDALMGADRNGDMSISSFQDPQVCKLFLAGSFLFLTYCVSNRPGFS